jgi:general secretion pathway protein M
MMTMLPSGRAGQALASGLLALVLLLTWIVVVSPLIAWHADRGLLLQQRQELASRMALLTQSLPQLERQAAEVTGPVPGAIIEATSDAVAAAILQQAVQDMAARSGATLSSTEALPAEQLPGYRRIGLRVAMTAPWPVLVQVLRAIGQATPQMLVDDLQVHGGRILVGQTAPPLDISWTVMGFRVDGPRAAP